MKRRTLVLASAVAPVAFAAAVLVGAAAVASCTSTQTQYTYTGVCNGTVTFSIASPSEGACLEPAADGTVPITVEALNFALRPPGAACAYVCNCGFLEVYVDGALSNRSGTAVIDAKLGDRGMPLYGPHQITVQLVWDYNDGGDSYDAGYAADAGDGVGPKGAFRSTVNVVVAPSCKDAGFVTDDGGTGDGGTEGGVGDAGSDDGGPGDGGPGDGGPGDGGSSDGGLAEGGSSDGGLAEGGDGG